MKDLLRGDATCLTMGGSEKENFGSIPKPPDKHKHAFLEEVKTDVIDGIVNNVTSRVTDQSFINFYHLKHSIITMSPSRFQQIDIFENRVQNAIFVYNSKQYISI